MKGKGCLALVVVLALLWFVTFNTELGWTYFASMGHFEGDVRQVLGDTLHPVQARMLTGSRAGYAWIEGDDAAFQAFGEKLLGKGFTVYPDPKEWAEAAPNDRAFLGHVALPWPTPADRKHFEDALAGGQGHGFDGGNTHLGSLAQFFFVYVKGEKRALLLCAYPYG